MDIPKIQFLWREDLDSSFLPTKSEPQAAGWDVKAAEGVWLKEYDTQLIDIGIRSILPEGWYLELRPRSSTFYKKHINCLYGIIDSSYRQSIKLACQYIPPSAFSRSTYVERGERIAQLIPRRIESFEISAISSEAFDSYCENEENERKGGFGSSGDR